MSDDFLGVTTLDDILSRLGEQPPAQALHDIAAAVKLVGETQLPNVRLRGDPESRDDQLRFGHEVLEAARMLAQAREAHPAESIAAKQVELSTEDLSRWSKPIYDAVNAMQAAGVHEHAALGILMYAAGAIAGQMRVVLPGAAPLKDALPPLFQGWEKGRAMMLAQQPEKKKH